MEILYGVAAVVSALASLIAALRSTQANHAIRQTKEISKDTNNITLANSGLISALHDKAMQGTSNPPH